MVNWGRLIGRKSEPKSESVDPTITQIRSQHNAVVQFQSAMDSLPAIDGLRELDKYGVVPNDYQLRDHLFQLASRSDVLQAVLTEIINECFAQHIEIYPRYTAKCAKCGVEYHGAGIKGETCTACGEGKLEGPPPDELAHFQEYTTMKVNDADEDVEEICRQVAYSYLVCDDAYVLPALKYDESGNEITESVPGGGKQLTKEFAAYYAPAAVQVSTIEGNVGKTFDGNQVYFCVFHRDVALDSDPNQPAPECPVCSTTMREARAFTNPSIANSVTSQRKVANYYRSFNEFIHGPPLGHPRRLYGLSRLYALYDKLALLRLHDRYMINYFAPEAPPRAFVGVNAPSEQVKKSMSEYIDRRREDPATAYVPIFSSTGVSIDGKETGNLVQTATIGDDLTQVEHATVLPYVINLIYATYNAITLRAGTEGGSSTGELVDESRAARAAKTLRDQINRYYLLPMSEMMGMKAYALRISESSIGDKIRKENLKAVQLSNGRTYQQMGHEVTLNPDGEIEVSQEQVTEPAQSGGVTGANDKPRGDTGPEGTGSIPEPSDPDSIEGIDGGGTGQSPAPGGG